ncbi:class III cytochrome C family protein [Geobacter sp. OR-1]|uniref:cytochrome c3 family protein n=1 Tax=Geobacter sp. OR-1 TaxID=1266765 RepID=UPI0005437E72|nr:cytochrome c3 family protein [Geobacter sp. OR-1]GAM08881.1 class III cytochrome C family protein [Geobacter sp. OR-1]
MKSCRIATVLAMLVFGATSAGALELKDITYNTENAGKVVFSHKKHLEKKPRRDPLQCKACHENGKKAPEKANMAGMEKGKSCGACHNGRGAFALASCTRCHKVREVSINVKQTGPVVFSHQKHLKKYQDCAKCHNALFKTGKNPHVTMAAMGKGESCGACHTGKQAFPLSDCQKCHPYRDKSYKVKDAGNVVFSHKAHLDMSFSCQDCHDTVYKPGKGNPKVSMTEMEKGKSCGACHNGKKAFNVTSDCATCHKSS